MPVGCSPCGGYLQSGFVRERVKVSSWDRSRSDLFSRSRSHRQSEIHPGICHFAGFSTVVRELLPFWPTRSGTLTPPYQEGFRDGYHSCWFITTFVELLPVQPIRSGWKTTLRGLSRSGFSMKNNRIQMGLLPLEPSRFPEPKPSRERVLRKGGSFFTGRSQSKACAISCASPDPSKSPVGSHLHGRLPVTGESSFRESLRFR